MIERFPKSAHAVSDKKRIMRALDAPPLRVMPESECD
jgi:hypothetical protein